MEVGQHVYQLRRKGTDFERIHVVIVEKAPAIGPMGFTRYRVRRLSDGRTYPIAPYHLEPMGAIDNTASGTVQ